jgi:hypothetical protein
MIKSQGVPKIIYFKNPVGLNLDGKTYTVHHIKTETLIQIINLNRKSLTDNFSKIMSLLFSVDECEFKKVDTKRYWQISTSLWISLGQNLDFDLSNLIGGIGDS